MENKGQTVSEEKTDWGKQGPNGVPAASWASSSDSLNQTVQREELHLPPIILAHKGRACIGGGDRQLSLGICASKNHQTCWVELASRPFAFDGQRRPPAGQPDEVHLVALLVPPVPPSGRLQVRGEFVDDVVFPEPSKVVRPAAGPTSKSTHEAGIEAIHLGSGDAFVAAAL